jgi:uncharacterized protein
LNLALANVGNLLRAIPEKHYDLVLLFNGPAVTLLQTEPARPFARRSGSCSRPG